MYAPVYDDSPPHSIDMSTIAFKLPLKLIFFFVPVLQTSPPFGETTFIVGVIVDDLLDEDDLELLELDDFDEDDLEEELELENFLKCAVVVIIWLFPPKDTRQ